MRCPGCGVEAPEGSSACPVCGRQFSQHPNGEARAEAQAQSTGTSSLPAVEPVAALPPPAAQPSPAPLPGFGTAAPTSQGMPQGTPQVSTPPPGFIPYPGYPAPGYPAPGYPAPGYPAPGMASGMYPPPAPPKRNTGLIVALAVVAVVVLLCCAGGIVGMVRIGRASTSALNAITTQVVGTETAIAATPIPQVLFQDPLTKNTNGWTTNTHCKFESNGFHILGAGSCAIPEHLAENVDLRVTTQVNRIRADDNDSYGVYLHTHGQDAYFFLVTDTGKWDFEQCDPNSCIPLTEETPNPAITTGPHAINHIEVRVQDGTFTFFVNDTQVGTATGTSYTSDEYGLAGGSLSTDDIRFSNLTVTTAGD